MDISWESVIGHEVNKKRLQTLLAEDRMPHALLFCGPEGTGKRRLAGVLAAALLCSSVKGRPCGHCDIIAASGDYILISATLLPAAPEP